MGSSSSSASLDNRQQTWAGQTCTIAVLGESGVGKSSVLNTLAQADDLFETGDSAESITLKTEVKQVVCKSSGLHLRLIDTQGTRDTAQRDAEFVYDIQGTFKGLQSVNVFLFVMNGRNSRIMQYRDALVTFGKMLGPQFWNRLVFCFTHIDYCTDDPKRSARAKTTEKQKDDAVSKMMVDIGHEGTFQIIFLDNELTKYGQEDRPGDVEELRKNIERLYEFAMSGEPYSCAGVIDDSVLMPSDVTEARRVGSEVTRMKLQVFEKFIIDTRNDESKNAYLQYALISEHQDELVGEWIAAVSEHGEHVYDLHVELIGAMTQKLMQARLDIFGAQFVQRQQQLLKSGSRDLDAFRRCPFCNIVWWNEGGCAKRRCGHHGAPDWNVDRLDIPRRGQCRFQHGCGRKFEWPMAPTVSPEHLKRVLAPHELPMVRAAKAVTKQHLRGLAKRVFESKRQVRKQQEAEKLAKVQKVIVVKQKHDLAKQSDPSQMVTQPEVLAKPLETPAQKKRKTEKELPVEIYNAGGGKCYLPNAVFSTPDGHFLQAKSIPLDSLVRSVDGQAIQIVRVSHHQSREKQHIVEFVTAQGNFKTSASHKIRVPGNDGSGADFALAGHLNKGDIILVGTKPRKLDNVRHEWTRTDLIEIGFHPDLPVEMFMIKEYGLQTYGSDASIAGAQYMDAITEEELLRAQPDVYMD